VGETVGYGNSWTAERPSVIATLAAGYSDGLLRTLSNRALLWDGTTPCPLVGRVSMDLITADITDLAEVPRSLDIIGPHQGVDELAGMGGTIGYELLTALGPRYQRRYQESRA
jgi:alanine racemase